MKVCIIGKYPPIQGGVSKSVYITSHDLARVGHKIHIVTNADEVENAFRLTLDEKDIVKREVSFANGYVRVHNIDTIHKPEYSHIPSSAGYETRLFGKVTEILRNDDFDLIIGWYYQPYGFVASLLAKKFNIPFMLIHAGSDVGRLIKHPQLKLAFQHALESADFIVSQEQSPTWNILKQNGAKDNQLLELQRGRILPKYFSGNHSPLNLEELCLKGFEWLDSIGLPANLPSKLTIPTRIKASFPTIAIYGKVGYTKGSYDLIQVLSDLAEEGLKFNFCTVPLGPNFVLEKYFSQILESKELVKRLFVLPPIANWKIPNLIAAFDVTCFLERGFDIEFHTPQVPLEILAGGSCLVCSKEILDKMPFREIFADGINLVEIEDPRDIKSFKDKLRELLLNKVEYTNIARRGKKTYEAIDRGSNDKSSVTKTIEKAIEVLQKHKNKLAPLIDVLSYKNDFVVDCFLKNFSMPREEAEDIFYETIKWLYLCAYYQQHEESNSQSLYIFGGTQIIDEMWHTFILCTKDYFTFCEKYLGKFIHHQPISKSEQEAIEQQYLLDRKKKEEEVYAEFKIQMNFVYEVLGEETVIKWFDTYLDKYSLEKINLLKMALNKD